MRWKQKALYEVKASGLHKLYKTLGYWSRDKLNFDFLEKDPGIVSPASVCMILQQKCFYLYIFSINEPSFIFWLSLFLKILGNICIAIVCFTGCNAINFEINFIFQSSPFSTGPKSQDKNLNVLITKRDFKVKWIA